MTTTKSFDLSKLRKSITKSIPEINAGFDSDPSIWISTGSYVLNKRISGSFFKGLPLGRVTMFSGDSGAGKSYICSGSLIKDAQRQNIQTVLIDTERALDEQWLQKLGVDTSPEKLLKLNINLLDELTQTITMVVDGYADENKGKPINEQVPLLIIIDSIGMLSTKNELKQFEEGDIRGQMGGNAKALKALIKGTLNKISNYNIGLVCTNHSYKSQDPFDPEDKISGGSGFIYASSIVIALRKTNLKEDLEGNKTTDIKGIKSKCKIMKTRFAKPNETVDLTISYETGLNPYSGLFTLLEEKGYFKKEGHSFIYTYSDGTTDKKRKKEWLTSHDELNRIMKELDDVDFDKISQKQISEDDEEIE